MDGQYRPHPGDAGFRRGRLAARDEPGGKPARPRTPRAGLRRRRGFTYTVLSTATGEVIGCVYIYPPRGEGPGSLSAGGRHTAVRSWVRADHAALDPVLYHAVRAWLERHWPFRSIQYAPRD